MYRHPDDEIAKAFENKKFEWRTISGVAREAGVSQSDVQVYIQRHGDSVVKSSVRNQHGEPLYTSRESRRKKAGIASRILSAVRNRGA